MRMYYKPSDVKLIDGIDYCMLLCSFPTTVNPGLTYPSYILAFLNNGQ
jgi:hypothetical protein